ncbi:MAG: type II secretion system protein N [Desulfopila sp.]
MAKRFSRFFPFLLITLGCVFGVELFYLGVERYWLDPALQQDEVTAEATPAAIQEGDRETGRVRVPDPAIITERNLFGQPAAEGASPANSGQTAEDLEPTSLEIVLMGTVNGDKAEERRAFILNKRDRKQEMYRHGDVVQGAVLKEIQRGVVILTLDGRDEKLDMSEAAEYGRRGVSPTARQVVSPASAAERSRVVGPADGTGPAVRARLVQPLRRVVRPRTAIDQDLQIAPMEAPIAELPEESDHPELVESNALEQVERDSQEPAALEGLDNGQGAAEFDDPQLPDERQ